MRALQILGLVLILFGGYVLVRGLSVKTDREVLDIGGVKASVEERRPIPAWAGAVAAGLGVVLIISGARRGSAAR